MRPPPTVLSNGRGNRTVLIHGAFGSPRFWSGPLPRSLRDGRVIAYPLPAHGGWRDSPAQLDRVLHPARMADAYASAIRHDFAGQAVNVVGHSTGAFVAATLAARHPHLVKRVALVGGFVDGAFAGPDNWLKRKTLSGTIGTSMIDVMLKAWTATPTTFRAGMHNMVENWETTKRCPDFDAICERVRLDLRNANSVSVLRVLKWLSRTRIWNQLPDIRSTPVVIGGRRDRVVSFAHQRQVASHLNSRILTTGDMGHLPMVENPKWFGAMIDRWASG